MTGRLLCRLGAEQVFQRGLNDGGLVLFEKDVAVDGHAGTGGDEAADDDVFLEAAQVVDAAGDGRFGEDARGLLERRRGDERVGRERRFGDAEEERHSVRRLAAAVHDLFVLFHEAEAIDLLVDEEIGVADARDRAR